MPTELTMELQGMDALVRRLDELQVDVADYLEGATRSGGLVLLNAVQDDAPYLAGDYRRSIHMETVEKSLDNAAVAIGTNDERGPWLEYGTGTFNEQKGAPRKPYVILPKNKKALAFKGTRTFAGSAFLPGASGEGTIVVKKVIHPGIPAQPHFRPAFDSKQEEVREEVRLALGALIQAAGGEP